MRYGLENLWNILVRSTLLTFKPLPHFCYIFGGFSNWGSKKPSNSTLTIPFLALILSAFFQIFYYYIYLDTLQ